MIAAAPTTTAELYQQRKTRYLTAMRNGKPDRIPIRPLVAEFTAKYAGYTCQEVTHDYRCAFEAVIRSCRDFDWDAVVPNMVWVWTGLTQAASLTYYGIPGIDIGPDVGFQYREPSEQRAYMQREDYARLIEDPTRFLYDIWLPRVSADVIAPGAPATYRNNLAFVKGGMAMLAYFNAFGAQVARMRDECGTLSAISGMLKAPLDILADKLRGYVGLAYDLMEIPDTVLAACRALQPHLEHVAISGADPEGNVPVTIWMHRGCVPFISHEHFDRIYWPTLKPILEAIRANGNQTLLYAEGDWTAHLSAFAELPAGSVIFHLDRTDIAEAKRVLGGRFCLSGGVPNDLLSFGTPEAVRAKCKHVIDTLAGNGAYIMDASAIVQNDASVENIRAMTDFTREYGVYGAGGPLPPRPAVDANFVRSAVVSGMRPGVCLPWAERPIPGDAALARRIWEETDSLAYTYIWNVLEGF